MKQYFITGTNTNVGKTLVSAILVAALKASYWKPIQSGLADEISDAEKIKALTKLPSSHFLETIYSLQASLSPHQAAKKENILIDLARCQLPRIENNLIIEGAGGVVVPVNDHESLLDLMQNLNIPVIIVARGTLGTINHTLMTIAVLRQFNLDIHGIVFSGELNKDSQETIEQWGKVKTLFHVPQFDLINHTVLNKWVKQQQKLIQAALL